MMEQVQQNMAADDGGGGFASAGRIGIDFKLDRKHFILPGGQAQFMEQAREAQPGAFDRRFSGDLDLNLIVFSRKSPLDMINRVGRIESP